jgi:hypothetical protein
MELNVFALVLVFTHTNLELAILQLYVVSVEHLITGSMFVHGNKKFPRNRRSQNLHFIFISAKT